MFYQTKEVMKYEPSNGSEFTWFIGKFCDQCKRGPLTCGILTKAILGEYQPEWTYENDRPVCTAFQPLIEEEFKDPNQLNLFV
jgi:hypothetical protein